MNASRTAALVLALATPALAVSGSRPPPCRVELRLTPERAVVGEQVVYAARITRRPDVRDVHWATPPGFPGFRVEWLPSRTFREDPQGGDSGPAVEERRALFPVRAGKLELPPAVLGCSLEGGNGRPREFLAETPPASLDVSPPPEAGRPSEWTGLVGSVRADAEISAASLHLGESVRIRIRLLGEANLWDAAVPFGDLPDDAGVELLPRPDLLELDPGARLHVRRSFAFDLVPRRTGTLVLPEIRVAYWNPVLAGYRSARASLPAIEVAPREAAPSTEAPLRVSGRRRPAGAWIGLLAGALVLGIAGVGLVRWRRRALGDDLDEAARALARAEALGARPEAGTALEHALRAELARRIPGAGSLSVEEIRATGAPGSEPALDDLERLERARFDPEAPTPDLAALRARLRSRLRSS